MINFCARHRAERWCLFQSPSRAPSQRRGWGRGSTSESTALFLPPQAGTASTSLQRRHQLIIEETPRHLNSSTLIQLRLEELTLNPNTSHLAVNSQCELDTRRSQESHREQRCSDHHSPAPPGSTQEKLQHHEPLM